jgi:tetratricopeptide (TPR) repeat protein
MKRLFPTYILILIAIGIASCKTSKTVSTQKDVSHDGFIIPSLSEKANLALERAYFDGLREKYLGTTDKAEDLFRKCLKIYPKHAASYFELAQIFADRGDILNAETYIKKAIEYDNSNNWYKLFLARIYDINGRYSESAKIYEQLVKANPKVIDYYYDWAMALIYDNQLKEAAKVYDLIEQHFGVSEEITMQKQKIHISLNDIDAAIADLKKLIEKYPDNGRYYQMLGELYLRKDLEKEALNAFNKALEINPKLAYINLSLYEYYHNKNQETKAAEFFQKAFADPNLSIDAKVQLYLTRYFTLKGIKDELKEEAVETGKTLVQTHPDEAKAHTVFADLLYRIDKNKEAYEEYKKAITLDNSKAIIWNQLLTLESTLEYWDSLYTDAGQAIELFPNLPVFYLFKGIAAIQLKKYQEAVDVLNAGKDLVFNNNLLLAQFYSSLGDAYHAMGNNELSDKSYEEALKLDPENVYVLNNYSYYLSLRKENLERAEEMSLKSNELQPNTPSFLDTYAWIKFQMGEYETAKQWLEKALNSGGSQSPTIVEHYGDVLYKLGDKEKALEYWNKALELGSKSPTLIDKIEKGIYIEAEEE